MAISKKALSVSMNEQRMGELRHLAVDTDKSLGTLLEEAVQEPLKKCEKEAKKYHGERPREK